MSGQAERGAVSATWSLARFTGAGYDPGRPWVIRALWFAVSSGAFQKWWFPARLRPAVLRMFGASIGERVLVRHGVRVMWPWKVSIGSNSWLGEDVWLITLEPVTIGTDVCLSQGAVICTGSHDRFSPSFEYDNAPIYIGNGVWVGTMAVVLRGVTLGDHCIVPACSVVSRDVPTGSFPVRQPG